MPLYNKIRELIAEFHGRKISVRQFRERFVILFQQSAFSDKETEKLAMFVEGTYAEFIENVINESELINRLTLIPSSQLDIRKNILGVFYINLQPTENTPVIPASLSWHPTGSLQKNTFSELLS